MLFTLKKYVNDSKATVAKTAGFVGGIYIAKRYITNRLDEVKSRLEQERAARERSVDHFYTYYCVAESHNSLRRRFQQTQDDVAYTVLALLPTLGDQILGNMDVEAITRELQTRSRVRNTRQPSATATSSGIGSSIHIVQEHEVRSENGSVSTTFSLADPDSSTHAGGSNTNGQISELGQDPLSSSFNDSGPLSVHSSQLVRRRGSYPF